MENNKKLDLALLILRIGLAVVFLLFGYQKLSSPAQTTSEIQILLNFLGLGAVSALNFYLGLTEIAVGLGLILGVKVKLLGFLAALFTTTFFASFLVKLGLSINPDIYRDIGLTAAGVTLGILGGGRFAIEKRKEDQSILPRI